MHLLRALALIILLIPALSVAGITVTAISGASNYTGLADNDEEDDTEAIFGGTAGSDCSSLQSGDESPCSNCVSLHGSDFEGQACNDSRVYQSLKLKITFTSDSTDGTAAATDSDGDTALSKESDSTGSLSQGGSHTISVTWGEICTDILGIAATCASDATGTIAIGVDNDGDGKLDGSNDDKTTISIQTKNTITAATKHCSDTSLTSSEAICGFEMFPGDKKAFISSLSAPSGFPQGDQINFDQLRIYFTESTDFNSITHSSSFATLDIEKNDDGVIEANPDAIGDLTNGSTYVFRIATVDRAKNVGFHSPITRSDTSTAWHDSSIHSVTPSPVSALLSEDFQCFIATAAYGTPLHKEVKLLRKFRSEVLLKSEVGRLFVRLYYKLSPPLADVIANNELLRQWSRWLLLPVVATAKVVLNWSFAYSIVTALLFCISLISLFIALRRRQNKAVS